MRVPHISILRCGFSTVFHCAPYSNPRNHSRQQHRLLARRFDLHQLRSRAFNRPPFTEIADPKSIIFIAIPYRDSPFTRISRLAFIRHHEGDLW